MAQFYNILSPELKRVLVEETNHLSLHTFQVLASITSRG